MTRIRLGVSLVLIVALGAILAAKRTPPAIPPISLAAQDWSIRYSLGMPAKPSALTNMAGWFFDFPTGSSDSVNYVTTSAVGQSWLGRSYVTFTAQVIAMIGDPVFNYQLEPSNTCQFPAHARAYLERRLTEHGAKACGIPCAPPEYRWWANSLAFELDDLGTATIVVPLTGIQWSDVYGEFASTLPQSFAAALQDPGAIGLTFGGGCFFGHGVNVQGGTARFVLTGYSVQ